MQSFIDLNAQRLTRSNGQGRIYPVLEPDRAHVAPPDAFDADAGGQPLAAKKKVKKTQPAFGAKKAFVLANPDISAPELVKLAKKAGITISEAHVYNVRSARSSGSKKTSKKKGKRRQTTVEKVARATSRVPRTSPIDSRLMAIFAEMMIPVVRQAVADELRRRLGD